MMDSVNAKVYRITAELRSPIIAMPYGLGLDSLLSAAIFAQTGKFGHEAMACVPVAATIHSQGDAGCQAKFVLYHASCAYFANPVVFTKETIMRRRRRDEIGPEFFAGKVMRKGASGNPWSVDQGKGDYNALIPEYQVTNTSTLVWFVKTDQPQLVCDLLSSLAFIGKRRGQGFGELGQVGFCAAGMTSALIDAAGYPLRPIPLSIWSTWKEFYAGNKDARVEPSAGYSISAWENEPMLCAMPQSPYIDAENAVMVDADGFVG